MAIKMLPTFKKGSTLEDTTKKQLRDHRDAHFMMVDGMSKLMTGKVIKCRSSDFHVSGLQWCLTIGQRNAKKDYLPFRLRITDKKCTGPNWNVKCIVKLSVLAQTHFYILESFPACFKENLKFHGSNSSISYGMLKDGYIVNDKAVFVVEITDVVASFPVTTLARNMGTAECIKPFEVPRNNSRFTWKITRFSSFNGKRHSSDEFTLGPRRWKIVMYPEGKLGHFSLYLAASGYVGPKRPTFANYKLRVLDQVKRNHHETEEKGWFFSDKPETSGIGRKKFMPLEELHDPSNGYLVNDEIYIGV